MNKYLLMSAAAVMASTSVASAATHNPSASGSTSFYGTTGGGGAYCNEWAVTWVNKVEVANSDNLETYCGLGYVSYGMGLAGKVKGFGKVADLPASIATEEGAPTYGSDFVVKWPLKTGGTYEGLANFGNVSIFEFSAGGIVLGQAPAAKRSAGQAQGKLLAFAKQHGHVSK